MPDETQQRLDRIERKVDKQSNHLSDIWAELKLHRWIILFLSGTIIAAAIALIIGGN